MKRQIITIFLLLAYFFSHGQNAESDPKNELFLGLLFSPDYCYRILKTDQSGNWLVDLRDSLEVPKFGFTTGLDLLFKFNRSIALEAGIQFSDKGQQTIFIEVIPVEPDPAIPDEMQIRYHYYYIDLPVKANYFVLKRKLKLFVSAGISTNIFLSHKTTVENIDSGEKHDFSGSEDLSRLNFAVLGGVGMDFTITERLNLRFEPIFRYALTPIVDAPIKQYLYSIGANFGLFLNLK